MSVTARGLRVTSFCRADAGEVLRLPLYLCRVPAGFPSPADDYVESQIDLNEWLVRNRLATFIVRVEGDSMSGEIHSGTFPVLVLACPDDECGDLYVSGAYFDFATDENHLPPCPGCGKPPR